jgi:hypothetical protein
MRLNCDTFGENSVQKKTGFIDFDDFDVRETLRGPPLKNVPILFSLSQNPKKKMNPKTEVKGDAKKIIKVKEVIKKVTSINFSNSPGVLQCLPVDLADDVHGYGFLAPQIHQFIVRQSDTAEEKEEEFKNQKEYFHILHQLGDAVDDATRAKILARLVETHKELNSKYIVSDVIFLLKETVQSL